MCLGSVQCVMQPSWPPTAATLARADHTAFVCLLFLCWLLLPCLPDVSLFVIAAAAWRLGTQSRNIPEGVNTSCCCACSGTCVLAAACLGTSCLRSGKTPELNQYLCTVPSAG
jgi:hypothetical protein